MALADQPLHPPASGGLIFIANYAYKYYSNLHLQWCKNIGKQSHRGGEGGPSSCPKPHKGQMPWRAAQRGWASSKRGQHLVPQPNAELYRAELDPVPPSQQHRVAEPSRGLHVQMWKPDSPFHPEKNVKALSGKAKREADQGVGARTGRRRVTVRRKGRLWIGK